VPGTNGADDAELLDLVGEARERAVPVLIDSFSGIYRWHAKRTLRSVPTVRAAVLRSEVVAVSLLDRLEPEVGYVYYIATLAKHRRRGFGLRLLDDALELFRRDGAEVVFAAVREENAASRQLFERRGFRATERKELSYREGGLGAWGLRSRMWVVSGEVLLGVRLAPPGTSRGRRAPSGPNAPPGTGPRSPP
jgi:ribosomal protein S18 acetylase RimI-like enzyme